MTEFSFRQIPNQQFFFSIDFNATWLQNVRIYRNGKLWTERFSQGDQRAMKFDTDKNTSNSIILWKVENICNSASTQGKIWNNVDVQLWFGFDDGFADHDYDDARVAVNFLIKDKEAYLNPADLAINHVAIDWVVGGGDVACGAEGRTWIVSNHPSKTIRVHYHYQTSPNSPFKSVVDPNGRNREGCGKGVIDAAEYI